MADDTGSGRKKRKAHEAGLMGGDRKQPVPPGEEEQASPLSAAHAAAAEADAVHEDVARLVASLRKASTAAAAGGRVNRHAVRRDTHALAEVAKLEENVDLIVDEGGVDVLVPLLDSSTLFPDAAGGVEAGAAAGAAAGQGGGGAGGATGGAGGAGGAGDRAAERCDDVEKEAAFAVGLLAVKTEHQKRIADAGALPLLVKLLKKHDLSAAGTSGGGGGVARKAADAVTNLAHENVQIKIRVRQEGGIPPLVELLEAADAKVQRAAAGALRTLAFKNEDNKKQIVDCGALPTLVFMLRSEDAGIHYEAVGVVGNLVHSSAPIKKRVLDEGALQPVIGLLSSRCPESQREAALLIGQFATTDPDYKVKIVQRGAVQPLLKMLSAPDLQLREMAAFALGRLAQNDHNQAGICQAGGLRPLLDLLGCRNGSLQHNAAFALYGLADNEDNVAELVKEGGVQRLLDGELIVQASKDCVTKAVKRLEEKVQVGRVLKHLLYLLKSSEPLVQRRTAVALANLASESDHRQIFLQHGALEVLLGMLTSKQPDVQRDAAGALVALHGRAKKAAGTRVVEQTPPPPTPYVYLGEQYVNNPTLHDIVFVVEGREFHAHRIALLASSDAFRAMFDGGYREKQADKVEIPNIGWDVFEAMMRCVYTGDVEVTPEIAPDLLSAADQYLLEGLKKLCEHAIAKDLSPANVADTFELADKYHAPGLRQACALFTLERRQEITEALRGPYAYAQLASRMLGEHRELFTTLLAEAASEGDAAAAAAATDAAAAAAAE